MPVDSNHSLTIEGVDAEMPVLFFEGHEAMSQLFEFVLTIGCKEAIDASSAIRSKATLRIHPSRETEYVDVHGIVSRIEQESVRAGFRYRVTIVPWAWMLQHVADSRIFQDMAVPEIVQKVLAASGYAAGTDFRSELQATYVTREYCVQYRESNWDFVSRLLEEEGIFYYFEHTEEGHVLVLGDTARATTPVHGDATLVFRPDAGAMARTEHDVHVSRFHFAEEVRSGKVTLRDWNFLKPALLLESHKAGPSDENLEVYDYPGEYRLPGDGAEGETINLG
jgi:type VI secretion system secreted protein VgrG